MTIYYRYNRERLRPICDPRVPGRLDCGNVNPYRETPNNIFKEGIRALHFLKK